MVKDDLLASLDLGHCHVYEIVVPLLEHESAAGHRFEGWPPAVQRRIEAELARFGRAGARIEAVTTALARWHGRQACILALHYRKVVQDAKAAKDAKDATDAKDAQPAQAADVAGGAPC